MRKLHGPAGPRIQTEPGTRRAAARASRHGAHKGSHTALAAPVVFVSIARIRVRTRGPAALRKRDSVEGERPGARAGSESAAASARKTGLEIPNRGRSTITSRLQDISCGPARAARVELP